MLLSSPQVRTFEKALAFPVTFRRKTSSVCRHSQPSTPGQRSTQHRFHELSHWTGAKSRLDRQLSTRFGEHAYALEELVAELGAAFLCAEFGFDVVSRSAAYYAIKQPFHGVEF
jgi:hypothetical protein